MRSTIALALLVILGTVTLDAARPGNPGADSRTDGQSDLALPIELAAPAGVSEFFLRQVRLEAGKIWKLAGVRLAWDQDPALCEPPLNVWLDPVQQPRVVHQAPMASITFSNGVPTRAINLSVSNVEALFRGGAITDSGRGTHEMMVARALGRALAHEVGHYLLNEKAHTPDGLMRASWPIQEAIADDWRGFTLTTDQRKSARQRVNDQRAACSDGSTSREWR
jgi:hypothetical protein